VRGGWWVLRYRDYADNGARKDFKLGPVADYPDIRATEAHKAELRFAEKIGKFRTEINEGHISSSTGLTVTQFIEQSYWSRLDWRTKATGELHIEPSTVDGYKDIYKVHVQNNPFGKLLLRQVRGIDARRFIESIDQKLSHQTHLRIKNFMSGVFTWAITDEAYSGPNPFDGVKAGGWTKDSERPAPKNERERKIRESNDHAYTLEEVADMMEKLPEPARTVCAVAAFTGLTRSEIRGLKWDDLKNDTIHVRRKVVGNRIGPTKTDAREQGVYVAPILQKMLGKYRKEFPPLGDRWIFRGERLLRPLDLDNLSRRDIPQYISGAWFGWHAFRRGLGTRLNELGVDDTEIQSILRHADISTSQAYYILPNIERAKTGMKKLSEVARKNYGIRA